MCPLATRTTSNIYLLTWKCVSFIQRCLQKCMFLDQIVYGVQSSRDLWLYWWGYNELLQGNTFFAIPHCRLGSLVPATHTSLIICVGVPTWGEQVTHYDSLRMVCRPRFSPLNTALTVLADETKYSGTRFRDFGVDTYLQDWLFDVWAAVVLWTLWQGNQFILWTFLATVLTLGNRQKIEVFHG